MDEYIQKIGADNNTTSYLLESNSEQFEIIALATDFIDWKYFNDNISSSLKNFKK